MSFATEALKKAKAALKAAEEAEAAAEAEVDGAVPAEPVKPSEGSVYLGHVGEPAVEGKDY